MAVYDCSVLKQETRGVGGEEVNLKASFPFKKFDHYCTEKNHSLYLEANCYVAIKLELKSIELIQCCADITVH